MTSTQEISISLMENEFLFDFLLQVQQKKRAASRFIRRYDGPFLVVSHANGRQDLLQLIHLTTGKELGSVNIQKIVVPDGDPSSNIRPNIEAAQPLQNASPTSQGHYFIFQCLRP